MTLAAEGYLSVPLVALQSLVSATARFKAIVGSSNATAAAEHVYLQLGEDEEEEGRETYDKRLKHPRPRAIISTVEDWSRERAGPGEWRPTCSFLLTFEFVIPQEFRSTYNDECVWFNNQIGVILAEMESARDADTDGSYLPYHRIAMVNDPMPCDDHEHIEHFWGCELQVFYT